MAGLSLTLCQEKSRVEWVCVMLNSTGSVVADHHCINYRIADKVLLFLQMTRNLLLSDYFQPQIFFIRKKIHSMTVKRFRARRS
jgi:hypothetical protein